MPLEEVVEGVLIAIILGIVEGITEYLPISSTGHLILVGHLLGFSGEKAESFEVIIQLGAILSVLVLYKERFMTLLDGLKGVPSQDDLIRPGLRGAAGIVKLGLVSLPALAMGFLFSKKIKGVLFAPKPVAVAMAVGAVAIILIERFQRDRKEQTEVDTLTWKQAILIGCVQCCALWPGMSRSASTILGGMLVGLSRRSAAEFSFLAAVPILAAAAGKDFLDVLGVFSADEFGLLAIGFVVSFFTALVTVRWFVRVVGSWSLVPFAVYRLVVAAIVFLVM